MKTKVLISSIMFCSIVSLSSCGNWTPESIYEKTYTFKDEWLGVGWDKKASWSGYYLEDPYTDVSPREILEKNKDKINWNSVTFDSSTVLDFNGVDTNNIDNVIDVIDDFLKTAPRGELVNISVTIGSKDNPSISIENSLGVSKTYDATYSNNNMQAMFGEGDSSLFSLIYGGVSDYYAACLTLNKDIVDDLFNEFDSDTLETRRTIDFYNKSGTLIYGLNLYYQFEI